ncbi:MAG: coproporphyrinogen dehydrogenase HemZ, partial [Clostridia bacterium]|nr:coproporphyrinogen dehydrogenase HemZ [Clostridia bacterium]
NYCSFVTEPLHRVKNFVPEYVKLLREEISRSLDFINSNGKLFSVYVGGGTPTALTSEQIYTLFNGFPFQDIEFTIEAGRPDTIDAEKLDAIKAVGANRICVNPQTLVNRTLALIGRAHSAEDFMEKYALAKSYGFDINVDIIAGLNGENLDDFIYTTDGIVALSPENITVHTLSRKNGSALKNGGKFNNSEVEKMVDYAYAKIVESGYLPYYLYRQKQMLGNLENVGYCKSGKQCANNITTMEDCVSVVACGAGAISKIVLPEQNRIERFANMRDLRLYMQTFSEKLKDKLFFYEKQFTKQY